MSKRIILYILIILLFFGFLLINKTNNSKNQQETVVFWTLQLGTFDKYINNIISEFEKENPEIKIKWIDVPYSEGEKRTLASILTDNPPDLVNLTPDFSMLLAQKNALQEINKEDLKQFLPSLTDTLKYNDKYFGIPFYATSAVTLYNDELTQKANIKKLPKTYDDLFELAPLFKNIPNTYITMITFSENDSFLKILNKYNVNSPETIANNKSKYIYNQFYNMYKKGYLPKESITQTHRDALEKYMSGQIAYIVTGANFINMINENAPQIYKHTKILPQLTGDSGLYDYSLMNFIIPKKAHNKKSALKFALFFTNKQNQLEFAKLTTILPTNKEALSDSYFLIQKMESNSSDNYIKDIINSNLDIKVKARMISAKQLNKIQPPLKTSKNKKELNTLSSNYIQNILINDKNINDSLESFSVDWGKL